MSKRHVALSPCVVRSSFPRVRRAATQPARACGRCQIDGGGHEFLRQRSEACHKRQKMHRLLATPQLKNTNDRTKLMETGGDDRTISRSLFLRNVRRVREPRMYANILMSTDGSDVEIGRASCRERV